MLAVALGSNSEYCYSGGADARIHSWKIPDLNMDPYDGYGETTPSASLPFALPSPTGAASFPQHIEHPPVPNAAGFGGNTKDAQPGEAWSSVTQHVTVRHTR